MAETMETLAGQIALFGWFFDHIWLGVPGQYRDIYRVYNILAGFYDKPIVGDYQFRPIDLEPICSSKGFDLQFRNISLVHATVRFNLLFLSNLRQRQGGIRNPPLTPRICCFKGDVLISDAEFIVNVRCDLNSTNWVRLTILNEGSDALWKFEGK